MASYCLERIGKVEQIQLNIYIYIYLYVGPHFLIHCNDIL
jgi:hypothetical protein